MPLVGLTSPRTSIPLTHTVRDTGQLQIWQAICDRCEYREKLLLTQNSRTPGFRRSAVRAQSSTTHAAGP